MKGLGVYLRFGDKSGRMFLIIQFFLTILFLITRVKYIGVRDILESCSIFCDIIFYIS